ncbi:MAG TPA: transposase [Planctomycetaceae bacterium]|nr:transposase [Planctomycetaceae bacterium]
MELYVGLDISQSMTHLCVVDSEGKRIWEGKCPTTPEAIAETIRSHAPDAELIGMESGALSPYLWHQLDANGLPVVCIEARHAYNTLKEQRNKTDKHDARGIAQLVRTKVFKEVKVKSMKSHQVPHAARRACTARRHAYRPEKPDSRRSQDPRLRRLS